MKEQGGIIKNQKIFSIIFSYEVFLYIRMDLMIDKISVLL